MAGDNQLEAVKEKGKIEEAKRKKQDSWFENQVKLEKQRHDNIMEEIAALEKAGIVEFSRRDYDVRKKKKEDKK